MGFSVSDTFVSKVTVDYVNTNEKVTAWLLNNYLKDFTVVFGMGTN